MTHSGVSFLSPRLQFIGVKGRNKHKRNKRSNPKSNMLTYPKIGIGSSVHFFSNAFISAQAFAVATLPSKLEVQGSVLDWLHVFASSEVRNYLETHYGLSWKRS